MTKTRTPATRLFGGADAGHYTLPGDLTALRRAVDRLAAVQRPAHLNEADARQQLIDATVTAARTGAPDWPDADDVLAARRSTEAATVLAETRQAALQWLTGDHSAAVL